MIPKDTSRVIILIFVGLISALWVYINFDQQAGMIYLAMAGVTLLIYKYSADLFNGGKAILYGIDDNIGTDILWGLAAGGIFIFIVESTSITMGLPPIYPQATAAQIVNILGALVIVGVLASILEEALFRGAVLYITDTMMPIIPAVVVTGVSFAMFHWVAYGANVVPAFVGAFLFSTIACMIVLKTKSLIPGVIMHSMVNVYLLISSEQLLVIGGV